MLNKKFKLLIVDDTAKNIQVVASILKDENYVMSFATNGKMALSMVKDNSYDLILLDVMMPEMDGFEVCAILKSDEKTKSLPIIFLTAKTDEESLSKAFELGAVDFITKPFNSSELLARVRTHLKLSDYTKNLFEYKDYLERQVEQSYKDKKEKEKMLVHQSKLAELGDMIGAITHQWSQPLNVISILAQKIKLDYDSGCLNEEYVDKFSDDLLNQVDFMVKTIGDFKNFFKPDKDIKEFNIKTSINTVIAILQSQFNMYGIEVSLKGEELSTIGYQNEFKQVILNLLTNAKDAIISAREKRCFDGLIDINVYEMKGYVFVDVIDNGGGIPADVIKRIFEPYFTTKDSKGTGIGLYISKVIVEEHMKGELSVENENTGAKFTIKLSKTKKGESI